MFVCGCCGRDQEKKTRIGNGQWCSYCVANFVGLNWLNMTKCTALMTCHWRWTLFEPLAPGTVTQVAISKQWLKSGLIRTGFSRCISYMGPSPSICLQGESSGDVENLRQWAALAERRRRRRRVADGSSWGDAILGGRMRSEGDAAMRRCGGLRPSGFMAKLAKWVKLRMKLLYIYIYMFYILYIYILYIYYIYIIYIIYIYYILYIYIY